jgi:hypothetical protein
VRLTAFNLEWQRNHQGQHAAEKIRNREGAQQSNHLQRKNIWHPTR